MTETMRQRWRALTPRLAPHLRRQAAAIAAHPDDDFAMLWLLSDFAELIIHYAALVLMAEARQDPRIRREFRRGPVPPELLGRGRPTLGKWVSFVREMSRHLKKTECPGLRALDLERVASDFETAAAPIVKKRNNLAHGPRRRIKGPHLAEEIETLSSEVLKLVDCFKGLSGLLLRMHAEEFHLTSDHPILPTLPFIVPGEREESPRFLERIDDKSPVYADDSGNHSDATYGPVLGSFIEDVRPEDRRPRVGVNHLSPSELRIRLLEALAEFEASTASDEASDGSPGPTAERRGLVEALRGMLRPDEPMSLCLHAPAGSGVEQAIISLIRDESSRNTSLWTAFAHLDPRVGTSILSDQSFLDPLWATGKLAEIHAAVQRAVTADPIQLLLVVFGAETCFAREPRHNELTKLVDRIRQSLPRTHLLLSSTTLPPEGRPVPPGMTLLPLPPLDDLDRRRLYEAFGLRSGDLPDAGWDELPSSARDMMEHPAMISMFCRMFAGTRPNPKFEPHAFEDSIWREWVIERETHRSMLIEIGRECINLKVRCVPQSLWLDTKERTRTLDDLRIMGILADAALPDVYAGGAGKKRGIGVEFTRDEWLLRTLELVVDEEGTSSWDEATLDHWLTAAESFLPLVNVIAAKYADAEPRTVEALFERALAHRHDGRAALAQAVIMQSYSHHDPDLLEALAFRAAGHGDAAVMEAVLEAILQIAAYDQSLARPLLQNLRRRSPPLIDALVRHEMIHRLPGSSSPSSDEFLEILQTAEAAGHVDLTVGAAVSWAATRLREIGNSPELAAEAIPAIIRKLTPLLQSKASAPHRLRLSLELLRSESLAPPPSQEALERAAAARQAAAGSGDLPTWIDATLIEARLRLTSLDEIDPPTLHRLRTVNRWAAAQGDPGLEAKTALKTARVLCDAGLPSQAVEQLRRARNNLNDHHHDIPNGLRDELRRAIRSCGDQLKLSEE